MFGFGKAGAASGPVDLPLFPLNTVLFPGGLLPLRIFEQRYIEMAKACLKDSVPFGVCLITKGSEVASPAAGPVSFASVGTQALLSTWDMPQLGILHVTAVGGERFQVRSHRVEANGLFVASAARIPPEPPLPLPERFEPLAKLLELIATRAGPHQFPETHAYGDASWVGHRLAELLPLPLPIKQGMLEINDSEMRLSLLQKFLQQQGLA